MSSAITDQGPLAELDEWDDFVATRYKQVKARKNSATTARMPILPSPNFTV